MKYCIIILSLFSCYSASSQPRKDTAKNSYHLFNPTPCHQMRKFETDRPDATESPITLDAGHLQYETDLFKSEKIKRDGIKTIRNFYNAANIKLGITHSLDLQLTAETFTTTAIKTASGRTSTSDFGGLSVRVKKNLWGNDSGKTALSLLPFINLPVDPSGKVSGGIIFPFAASFANGWNFGGQIETDLANGEVQSDYHIDYSISATTSHPITKNLDFFFEGLALRNNGIKTFEYFLNGGFVYNLGKNVNFDTGVYYGLKKISSKTFFVGLSFRI